jgi:recombination protein RecA
MSKRRKKDKTRHTKAGAAQAPVAVVEEDRPTSAMAARISKTLMKEFGKDAVLKLTGDNAYVAVEGHIPFNLPALEAAVGAPGFPIRHYTEISGPEGCGKTSLCLHAIAQAQQAGYTAVLVDEEQSFDPDRAARDYRVNLEDLVLVQPTTTEACLAYIDSICEAAKGRPDVVAVFWDSLGGGVTEEELSKGYGEATYASAAKVLTPGLKKLQVKIGQCNVALIGVNQVRENIGAGPYAPKERTPGGRFAKHFAFLRVSLRQRDQIRKGKFALGIVVNARVIKNKLGPPFRTATFNLYFDGRTIQDGKAPEEPNE